MAADAYVMDADMKKVADAIRVKAGTTDPLVFPDGMKNAIDGISSEFEKVELATFFDFTINKASKGGNLGIGYNDTTNKPEEHICNFVKGNKIYTVKGTYISRTPKDGSPYSNVAPASTLNMDTSATFDDRGIIDELSDNKSYYLMLLPIVDGVPITGSPSQAILSTYKGNRSLRISETADWCVNRKLRCIFLVEYPYN